MPTKFSLRAIQTPSELQTARSSANSASPIQAQPRRRSYRTIERTLSEEHIWRCKALGILCVPVNNGIWLPAFSDEEKLLVAKIIKRAKKSGQLLPGAADLCVFSAHGAGVIELKIPASRDLFRARPAGRPSDGQLEFAALCQRLGVNHTFSSSWDQSLAAMKSWGML